MEQTQPFACASNVLQRILGKQMKTPEQRAKDREYRRRKQQDDPEWRARNAARCRRWRKRNPEKARELKRNSGHRGYYKTAARKYRTAYPEKTLAHNRVMKAILRGRLIRPSHCSNCKRACKPEAHHDDYSKPLEVRWLCKTCHMKHHGYIMEASDV